MPRTHAPSAYQEPPPLPAIDTVSSVRGNRDSVQTRASSSASSVYPNSNHTVSPSESSVSPHSLIAQPYDNGGVAAANADVDDENLDGFEGDDVSYRLRLLVKNSYFLPPAHSKPLSSDLISPMKPQKLSSRAGTPTFLDLFRLGKSKSRPSTPSSSSTTATESMVPILRTTSDTTSVGGRVPRMQARALPRSPSQPFHHGPSKDPTGRVVVVREIMDDLIVAAKEAEQDMKVREWRNSQLFAEGYTDVIDPTDAVDMPPPSASYPFAVQSTATHGLGVQQSVGAADLADRLIPPNTPGGASSLRPPDNAWREALLHEAVGHSLNNSPAQSMLSVKIRATPPVTPSPTVGREPLTPLSPVGPSKLKRALDQRIISQPVIESIDRPSDDVSKPANSNSVHSKGRHHRGLSTPESHDATRRLSYIPRRAETPSQPHTPLAPPPRPVTANSPRTTSWAELPNQPLQEGQSLPLSPPPWLLRKAQSSPTLSEAFEPKGPAPPMPPPFNVSASPVPMATPRHQLQESMSSASSYYTDEDQEGTFESAHRPSMAVSVVTTEGRQSFDERGRPSPSVSAFQDARYEGYLNSSPNPDGRMSRASDARTSPSPTPRYSTMSPPPRSSSSLAPTPLLPPPRSSSLHYKVITTRASPTPPATPSPTASRYPGQEPRSPTTPTRPQPGSSGLGLPSPSLHPLASRRGNAGPTPLMLTVNTRLPVPIAIHSAPPPASPASFFDNIQDKMHDLESSDESEDESENESDDADDADVDTSIAHEMARPRATSNYHHQPPLSPLTPPKASFSFSQHRNSSTPNVARPTFSPTVSSFSPTLARFKISPKKPPTHKPISNVPQRAPFFSSKKTKKSTKKSPLEFVHTLQRPQDNDTLPPPLPISNDSRSSFSRPPTMGSVTTGTDSVRDWQRGQSSQDESLRKLDGLVLQHMQAEKDRIKKIAKTMQESKP